MPLIAIFLIGLTLFNCVRHPIIVGYLAAIFVLPSALVLAYLFLAAPVSYLVNGAFFDPPAAQVEQAAPVQTATPAPIKPRYIPTPNCKRVWSATDLDRLNADELDAVFTHCTKRGSK
jgi:hypothetical protein